MLQEMLLVLIEKLPLFALILVLLLVGVAAIIICIVLSLISIRRFGLPFGDIFRDCYSGRIFRNPKFEFEFKKWGPDDSEDAK